MVSTRFHSPFLSVNVANFLSHCPFSPYWNSHDMCLYVDTIMAAVVGVLYFALKKSPGMDSGTLSSVLCFFDISWLESYSLFSFVRTANMLVKGNILGILGHGIAHGVSLSMDTVERKEAGLGWWNVVFDEKRWPCSCRLFCFVWILLQYIVSVGNRKSYSWGKGSSCIFSWYYECYSFGGAGDFDATHFVLGPTSQGIHEQCAEYRCRTGIDSEHCSYAIDSASVWLYLCPDSAAPGIRVRVCEAWVWLCQCCFLCCVLTYYCCCFLFHLLMV